MGHFKFLGGINYNSIIFSLILHYNKVTWKYSTIDSFLSDLLCVEVRGIQLPLHTPPTTHQPSSKSTTDQSWSKPNWTDPIYAMKHRSRGSKKVLPAAICYTLFNFFIQQLFLTLGVPTANPKLSNRT